MATVQFGDDGKITAVLIDGVDISAHVMGDPAPSLVHVGHGEREWAVSLNLVVESAPTAEAANADVARLAKSVERMEQTLRDISKLISNGARAGRRAGR